MKSGQSGPVARRHRPIRVGSDTVTTGLFFLCATRDDVLHWSFAMKIVLAYSGGLDTSVIVKWLRETYDAEIVTFAADIGQRHRCSGHLHFLD